MSKLSQIKLHVQSGFFVKYYHSILCKKKENINLCTKIEISILFLGFLNDTQELCEFTKITILLKEIILFLLKQNLQLRGLPN